MYEFRYLVVTVLLAVPQSIAFAIVPRKFHRAKPLCEKDFASAMEVIVDKTEEYDIVKTSREMDESSTFNSTGATVVTKTTTMSTTTTSSTSVSLPMEEFNARIPDSVDSAVPSSIRPVPSSRKTTIVYGIRHGTSVSNEWMTGDNTWGSPMYDDTGNTPDAPLSATGIMQAQELAATLQWQIEQLSSSELEDAQTRPSQYEWKDAQVVSHDNHHDWFSSIQLIVVSPLTRCLQTYQYAIQPLLKTDNGPTPQVLVHPLLAERVYSVSETGRPVSALQDDFPSKELDWNLLREYQNQHAKGGKINNDDKGKGCWWYDPSIPTPFNRDDDNASTGIDNTNNGDATPAAMIEWRPHGQGQNYGSTAGESMSVFSRRMEALVQWLSDRPETHILTVAHWGVYRHLTNGTMTLDNCQVCRIALQEPQKGQHAKTVQPLPSSRI